MSSPVIDPFLDLLRDENSKKARGQKNPFAGNPSVTDNEFFNPLENRGYSEVLQQMNRNVQPMSEKTSEIPTLSDLLNIAQREIRSISKHIGNLQKLAHTAADITQTDSNRELFQRDFFETVGKIEHSADRMNWHEMTISEGNNHYRIHQAPFHHLEEIHNPFTNPIDNSRPSNGASATTEITFNGNLNSDSPIITSIDGNEDIGYFKNTNKEIVTIKLSDGTAVAASDGKYTVGHSVPLSTIVGLVDATGKEHSIAMNLEKSDNNSWIVSLVSANHDGSVANQADTNYAYIKETDNTYAKVSFVDDDGNMNTSFKVDFDDYGRAINNLSSKIRFEYSTATSENSTTTTVLNPTINFSNLTQYVGNNTVYPNSNGSFGTETLPQTEGKPHHPHGRIAFNDPFNNDIDLLERFSQSEKITFINISLVDMHPRFLGTGNLLTPQGRFMSPFDQNMFDSFFGNTSKQNDWMDIVRGASNQNLNSINVLSQRNASIALRVIEGALSQVQKELSNVNSYIQRYTQSQSNNEKNYFSTNNFV